LLAADAVLLHEVLCGVEQRGVDRHTQPLDQALGVALVPGRDEDDRRLAVGREHLQLARDGKRVEEQQSHAVIDRVRRNVLVLRLARLPLRVLRLPVPEASL
jgi:hypothetical protein